VQPVVEKIDRVNQAQCLIDKYLLAIECFSVTEQRMRNGFSRESNSGKKILYKKPAYHQCYSELRN